MWSKEKLREAADKWMESLNPYSGNDWDRAETAYQSFLAGCDYIINNTQKKMEFKNYTPHSIKLNDGRAFPSVGVARVSNTFSNFENDVCSVSYGDIEGLPAPEDGTCCIVSNIVLNAAKAKGRKDCVAPATGHPDCVRENGFIKSVPGFVR
jgi:hypothetical protein